MANPELRPQPGPQEQFLRSPADIAIFGGSAGGGKSFALFLEPLYQGGIDDVTPGSSCIANAYSNNHDVIVAPERGAVKGVVLHAIDALGLVHALLLRVQALVLPFKRLVGSGH